MDQEIDCERSLGRETEHLATCTNSSQHLSCFGGHKRSQKSPTVYQHAHVHEPKHCSFLCSTLNVHMYIFPAHCVKIPFIFNDPQLSLRFLQGKTPHPVQVTTTPIGLVRTRRTCCCCCCFVIVLVLFCVLLKIPVLIFITNMWLHCSCWVQKCKNRGSTTLNFIFPMEEPGLLFLLPLPALPPSGTRTCTEWALLRWVKRLYSPTGINEWD